MRVATAAVVGLIALALAGVVLLALGAGGMGGHDGTTLSEQWVSDTGRPTGGNHHAPAAGRIRGEGLVFAPVSGRADVDECDLVAVNATDGETRWTYSVPAADCTIHSVADPTLADFDSDGGTEVLAATTQRAVLAFDPLTGEVEFRRDLASYGYTQPVVANLTGDGAPETVVVDVKGTVFVVRPNGTTAWTHRLNAFTWGQPAVADFDGDERPELVVAAGTGGLYRFEPNGTVAWRVADPFGSAITWMTTGDADDDPAREVVVATTDGRVVAVDGRTGSVQWRRQFAGFAAVHAFGDGDGDGAPEVYAVANDGKLRALSAADGSTEWTTTLTAADVNMMPPPSMGDVDGDGTPELVAPSNDGGVSVVDPANGAVLASYSREVSIFVHPTLADTDADGTQEIYVMYGDGRVVALVAG